MTTRIRPHLALVVSCACLAGPAWAQRHGGGGSHAAGGFGFHGGGGGSWSGRSSFRPSTPAPAPRPSYGLSSPYRGSPYRGSPYRGPSTLAAPGTSWRFAHPTGGPQRFRGPSTTGIGAGVRHSGVPRSAYLGARNPHYSTAGRPHGPTAAPWRSSSGYGGSGKPPGGGGGGHPGHSHPHHTQFLFFMGTFPFFFSPFLYSPFFYSPFSYPSYGWWWYPPLTFSDTFSSQGCPQEDYYYQRQRYNEPQQQAPEQPESGAAPESSEEAAPAPTEEPQAQSPLSYETPLPDVIEWGKATEAKQAQQATSAAKGPLIVNLSHHTLTILPSNPSPPAATGP